MSEIYIVEMGWPAAENSQGITETDNKICINSWKRFYTFKLQESNVNYLEESLPLHVYVLKEDKIWKREKNEKQPKNF